MEATNTVYGVSPEDVEKYKAAEANVYQALKKYSRSHEHTTVFRSLRAPLVRGTVSFAVCSGNTVVLIEVVDWTDQGTYALAGKAGDTADRVLLDGESFTGGVLTIRRHYREWMKGYNSSGLKVFPLAVIGNDVVQIGDSPVMGLHLTALSKVDEVLDILLGYSDSDGFDARMLCTLLEVKSHSDLTHLEEMLRDGEIYIDDPCVPSTVSARALTHGTTFKVEPGIGLLSRESVRVDSKTVMTDFHDATLDFELTSDDASMPQSEASGEVADDNRFDFHVLGLFVMAGIFFVIALKMSFPQNIAPMSGAMFTLISVHAYHYRKHWQKSKVSGWVYKASSMSAIALLLVSFLLITFRMAGVL